MPNVTGQERTLKQIFIGTCWEYLSNNFHKFSEANKIKIAMALAQKDMPTVMEGSMQFKQMGSIVVDNQKKDFDIGTPSDAGDTQPPGQTDTDSQPV